LLLEVYAHFDILRLVPCMYSKEEGQLNSPTREGQ